MFTKILTFDLETTSLLSPSWMEDSPATWAHPVQIGWCWTDYATGKLIESQQFYVWAPGFQLSPKAVERHGITEDILRSFGLAPEHVLNQFLNMLEEANDGSTLLSGFNITKFDIPVMRCAAWLLGREWPGDVKPIPTYDLMWAIYQRYGIMPKLEELVEVMFGDDETAHDALGDSLNTARCLNRMMRDNKLDPAACLQVAALS